MMHQLRVGYSLNWRRRMSDAKNWNRTAARGPGPPRCAAASGEAMASESRCDPRAMFRENNHAGFRWQDSLFLHSMSELSWLGLSG